MSEREPPKILECGGEKCPKGGVHDWSGYYERLDEWGVPCEGGDACAKCGVPRGYWDMLHLP